MNMAVPNYILPGKNGSAVIDCNRVPEKGFIDATKTKNVATALILSHNAKLNDQSYVPGGPDVLLTCTTGEREYITRKQLKKQFVHSNGHKIRIATLRSDTKYLIYNICETPYKVMKLPTNCGAILPDGRRAKPGSYIICKGNPDGTLDRSSMSSISPALLRKSFNIPMQSIIKKYKDRPKKSTAFTLLSNNGRRVQNTLGLRSRPKVDTAGFIDPHKINIPTTAETQQNKAIIQRNKIETQRKTGENNSLKRSTYRYTATARLLDMNKHLIGFELQDIQTGAKRNVNLNTMKEICRRKLVENIMLVRNLQGDLYLRGNGCSIDQLREVMV